MVLDVGNQVVGTVAILDSGLVYEKFGDRWIPSYVLKQGTNDPTIIATLKGDANPPSPWAKIESGTGTVTSDGTRVNIVSLANADNAGLNVVDTETAGKIRWVDALLTWNAMTGASVAADALFAIRDGVREAGVLTIDGSTDPFRYGLYANAGSGTNMGRSSWQNVGDRDLTVEHHVLMITDEDANVVWVYVDGKMTSHGVYSSTSALATKQIRLGDFGASGTLNLSVRELVHGTTATP